MRLYPPVPMDSKEALKDDLLPDGTVVKKGTMVAYHVYAMGRMKSIWGSDWTEFKPERWLESVEGGKWSFVGRDSYNYPVFQVGPRVCLGKEMAIMQMKRVLAGVMKRFRVVPEGVERSHFHFSFHHPFPRAKSPPLQSSLLLTIHRAPSRTHYLALDSPYALQNALNYILHKLQRIRSNKLANQELTYLINICSV